MKKHIHILGASGSGTTTLAIIVSKKLDYSHFDTDDYFWLPTSLPFTIKRPLAERVALLKHDIENTDKWILSGSNCGWGDFLMPEYDLVVFLYVPAHIRMERLLQRETQRYGAGSIAPGGEMESEHRKFLEWAAAYDNGDMEIRSLVMHNEWLKRLKCPVIRIEGEQSIEERVAIVMSSIIE